MKKVAPCQAETVTGWPKGARSIRDHLLENHKRHFVQVLFDGRSAQRRLKRPQSVRLIDAPTLGQQTWRLCGRRLRRGLESVNAVYEVALYATSANDATVLLRLDVLIRIRRIAFFVPETRPRQYAAMNVTVAIPDDFAARFGAGVDLGRRALEALALEEYRAGRLRRPELRRLLGFATRGELDGFLKAHGVYEDYTLADLDRERQALVARVLSRSRVERASRSSRVTISTSSASSAANAFRSWTRSVLAPLAVSRNTFLHPAFGELAHLRLHALAVR